MVDDNKIHPDATTLDYQDMSEDWPLIRDLMGETRAMRAAGEKWLPQWAKESDVDYKNRLNTTTLFNGLQRTVNVLTGKVYTSDLVLSEDTPSDIADLTDDIDAHGTKLQVYGHEWFKDGLEIGVSHTFVDSPSIHAETQEEAKANGMRPYWIHVPAENLIFWEQGMVNGKNQLSKIRIRETLTEPSEDGWGEVSVEEIREYRLEYLAPGLDAVMTYTVYRLDENSDWVAIDDGETEMNEIPLATFYARKTGYLTGKPPLMDLAWLNLTHWQSSSEQRHCLSISRRPFLAFFGFAPDDISGINIGPRSGPVTNKVDGRVDMIEASGAGNAAGRQDLQDLKEEMAVLGPELLIRKEVQRTATEASNQKQETESELGCIAQYNQDSMNSALRFTAMWMGLEHGGSVEVNKEFTAISLSKDQITALKDLWQAGGLSWGTMINALMSGGTLPSDLDLEDERAKIDAEGAF